MVWTGDPKTWAFQEGVESSELNTEMRDRFLAMGPHLIARKTADQSVTSSTVLVDCTTLGLPVAANEVWQCDWSVVYQAGTTGDLKLGFTFPTAGEVIFDAQAWPDSGGTLNLSTFYATTSPTTARTFFGDGANRHTLGIRGIYVNGANAGTVQLQFAQNTSDGSATTTKANSTLWAVRLA
jgi:hypothetical protein